MSFLLLEQQLYQKDFHIISMRCFLHIQWHYDTYVEVIHRKWFNCQNSFVLLLCHLLCLRVVWLFIVFFFFLCLWYALFIGKYLCQRKKYYEQLIKSLSIYSSTSHCYMSFFIIQSYKLTLLFVCLMRKCLNIYGESGKFAVFYIH